MHEIFNRIKDSVSTYSAALATTTEHGDNVTVGGEIQSIIRADAIFDGDEFGYGTYLTLDDGLGEVSVYVSRTAFEVFEEKHGYLKQGDMLLAMGRVHMMDKSYKVKGEYGTVSSHKTEKNYTVRVLCYSLAPLPEDIENVQ